jgi:hypothetical protein
MEPSEPSSASMTLIDQPDAVLRARRQQGEVPDGPVIRKGFQAHRTGTSPTDIDELAVDHPSQEVIVTKASCGPVSRPIKHGDIDFHPRRQRPEIVGSDRRTRLPQADQAGDPANAWRP